MRQESREIATPGEVLLDKFKIFAEHSPDLHLTIGRQEALPRSATGARYEEMVKNPAPPLWGRRGLEI